GRARSIVNRDGIPPLPGAHLLDHPRLGTNDKLFIRTICALESQLRAVRQCDRKLMARRDLPSRGISTSDARQWRDIQPPRVISLKHGRGLAIHLNDDLSLA